VGAGPCTGACLARPGAGWLGAGLPRTRRSGGALATAGEREELFLFPSSACLLLALSFGAGATSPLRSALNRMAGPEAERGPGNNMSLSVARRGHQPWNKPAPPFSGFVFTPGVDVLK